MTNFNNLRRRSALTGQRALKRSSLGGSTVRRNTKSLLTNTDLTTQNDEPRRF